MKKIPVVGSTYFTSPRGRNVVLALAGASTTGLFLANYVPHTLGLDYYRSFMQCYKHGAPMPVSPKLGERLEEAAKALDFNNPEKETLLPFSVHGFDLFAAGSTKSKFGAIIGIPFNYEVNNIEDIKRSNVCYRGEKIDWNSTSGKLLENALVLTEDEQIFGLCKLLLQIRSHYVLVNSLLPSITFSIVYCIGNYLNQSLHLLQKPFGVRLCLYCILSLFGLGSWSFMKDYNQIYCDTEIDKKLSSISPKLTKAGLGFYEKQLAKNVVLRELGGDDTFTKKGNLNYVLRQKSLPLTVRKSFFEEKYEQHLKTIN